MANLGKSFKSAWVKSMEAIGNTASNIASNTKYKVTEMNLESRKREILSDFGNQAYELYQKGESFPPVLEALLKELTEVDEKLIAIRMEHHSNETNANTEGDASDAALGVQPEEAVPSIQVEEAAEEKAASVPLSSDDPIAQLMSEQDLEKASTSAAHAAEFVRQTEDVVSNLGQAIDKAFDGMSDRQQDS